LHLPGGRPDPEGRACGWGHRRAYERHLQQLQSSHITTQGKVTTVTDEYLLSKTYANGTRALDAVTLQIPRGMFGLLGPNGAGKSTLMRSIATLQDVDSGSLRFGEIDIRKQPERLRELVGYLPQDFGVYPDVRCPFGGALSYPWNALQAGVRNPSARPQDSTRCPRRRLLD
jgi:ABC-type glutathione transport system ATPase component